MDLYLLTKLKEEYGEIYSIELGGREYAYRALTIKEIQDFEKNAENGAELEDIYVENGVVYPLDFDLNKIKAGYVSSLAEAIGNISGTNINFILNTLDNSRKQAQEDILIKIKAMIIAAMPAYTDEYLATLTMKQLLEKLVLSEEILTIHQIVGGIQNTTGIRLDLVPTEEEVAPKKQKPKVDKETLLQRIRHEERQTINQALTPITEIKPLEELDEDLLIKSLGVITEEDPIARKLRKAMGD